jgi:predicted DNA-binding antitoxin AbrB/MazE fold protein
MTTAIHAIYENGVFRPTGPVDLPERCEVEVEVRAVKAGASGEAAWEFPEEKSVVLSDRDRDRFLQLVENPPPPSAALRKAVSEYRKQYG